jgi:hypothetical protein
MLTATDIADFTFARNQIAFWSAKQQALGAHFRRDGRA